MGSAMTWKNGSIKWFDAQRRYGFVIPDEGGSEVFLYWRELRKARIPESGTLEGRRVRYTARPADKPGKCNEQVEQIKLEPA